MVTKTLTITEEAYDRLRAHKRADESFTDTILRITDPDRDPMAGFGAMSDVEGFREAVKGTRDRLDDDLRDRRERGNSRGHRRRGPGRDDDGPDAGGRRRRR
jgi:predicted CopG family antitoxin